MDGLDDIPFGPPPPPEQIPLVVPDHTTNYCTSTTKRGIPCRVPSVKGTQHCMGHTAALKARDPERLKACARGGAAPHFSRKPWMTLHFKNAPLTKDEVLSIISQRLRMWIERFGPVPSAETEQTICDLVHAYAKISGIETVEAAARVGWRMKGVS